MKLLNILVSPNMDLGGAILMVLLIMFGPPLMLLLVGIGLRVKEKKKAAKVLFILAALYLLISLGICGTMML
jgi:predicted membrane protein